MKRGSAEESKLREGAEGLGGGQERAHTECQEEGCQQLEVSRISAAADKSIPFFGSGWFCFFRLRTCTVELG